METHAFEMENDFDEQGEVEATEDGLRITWPAITVDHQAVNIDYELSIDDAQTLILALIEATRDHIQDNYRPS